MTGIGPVLDSFAFLVRLQKPGLGQPIQLNPYRIGAFLKFFGQTAQVGAISLMAKKPQKELDSSFGSN
jgi:hypothetical protein